MPAPALRRNPGRGGRVRLPPRCPPDWRPRTVSDSRRVPIPERDTESLGVRHCVTLTRRWLAAGGCGLLLLGIRPRSVTNLNRAWFAARVPPGSGNSDYAERKTAGQSYSTPSRELSVNTFSCCLDLPISSVFTWFDPQNRISGNNAAIHEIIISRVSHDCCCQQMTCRGVMCRSKVEGCLYSLVDENSNQLPLVSESFVVPMPPPAKFSRQKGRTQTQAAPKPATVQNIKRNIHAAIIMDDMFPRRGNATQENPWSAFDKMDSRLNF